MRRASRVDAAHRPIVDALRAVGCSVQSLHTVGGGCPDLLVATRNGRMLLLEVKAPLGPQGGQHESGQHLSEEQLAWWRGWRSTSVAVVRSVDEALRLVGAT